MLGALVSNYPRQSREKSRQKCGGKRSGNTRKGTAAMELLLAAVPGPRWRRCNAKGIVRLPHRPFQGKPAVAPETEVLANDPPPDEKLPEPDPRSESHGMIRKLKAGGHRLYSWKRNPATGKRRILVLNEEPLLADCLLKDRPWP